MHADRNRPRYIAPMVMLLFFVISTAAAQSPAASSGYGVRSQTADAGFNVGWTNYSVDNIYQNRTASFLAGNVGFNATRHIAVVGEFQYLLQGRINGLRSSGKLYGGVVRYTLTSRRVAPYLLGGIGGIRESGGAYGNEDADGWYAPIGGGVSVFLTRNIGFRPEFRYNRMSLAAGGITSSGSLYQASGGVFFQFGKRSPKQSQNPPSQSSPGMAN